jgi:hypothetical protein
VSFVGTKRECELLAAKRSLAMEGQVAGLLGDDGPLRWNEPILYLDGTEDADQEGFELIFREIRRESEDP